MFEAEEKSRMDKFFEIHNETKGKLPSLPFAAMKEYILGKTYELSLVFVPDETSTQLNFSYRGKNKPTNVLAFPLSKTEGEIFINPNKAKEEAREWSKTYEKFISKIGNANEDNYVVDSWTFYTDKTGTDGI